VITLDVVANWQELEAQGWTIIPCADECDEVCRETAPEFHEWEAPRVGAPTNEAPAPVVQPVSGIAPAETPERVPPFSDATDLTADPADEEAATLADALAEVREACTEVMPFYGPFERRNAAMVKAYQAGATFRQISEVSGITGERVRQIVKREVEVRGRGWAGMSERSRRIRMRSFRR
jgi:hypothetical protein